MFLCPLESWMEKVKMVRYLTCGEIDGEKTHSWTNQAIFYHCIGSNISVCGQNRPIQNKYTGTCVMQRDGEKDKGLCFLI